MVGELVADALRAEGVELHLGARAEHVAAVDGRTTRRSRSPASGATPQARDSVARFPTFCEGYLNALEALAEAET